MDASALVEVLLDSNRGHAVAEVLRRFETLHAPAHIDAEVLSAFGRLHRADQLGADDVRGRLFQLQRATITRHPLAELLMGAWARRDRFRLVDGLYVELAHVLGAQLLTTDTRLAAAAGVPCVAS